MSPEAKELVKAVGCLLLLGVFLFAILYALQKSNATIRKNNIHRR